MTESENELFTAFLKEISGAHVPGLGLVRYYKLDGHAVVPAKDMLDWARFFESTEHRIVKQDQIGDYWISTVFLGLDHRFGGRGRPLLFETMVFVEEDGKPDSGGFERYSTWDQAAAGHEAVCARLREHG